jgi:phosphatidylglycerophosphate synthase
MSSGAEPVLGNPRDGYIDRVLYRPLARPLTRALLSTPISPNAVTLASMAIGVAGGLLVGSAGTGGVLAGVVCLVASGILDCCDGELARLRHAESRLGHVLDVAGDTLVAVALLAGIVRRLVRSGPVPGWPVLAALGVGVAGAFGTITWSEVTEARRRRVSRWENRVLDRVLGPLTTRDWYVFPVAFALAGRLGWLVPAAAVGAHVFWVVTVVLLLRVLRVSQVQGSAPRVRQ